MSDLVTSLFNVVYLVLAIAFIKTLIELFKNVKK